MSMRELLLVDWTINLLIAPFDSITRTVEGNEVSDKLWRGFFRLVVFAVYVGGLLWYLSWLWNDWRTAVIVPIAYVAIAVIVQFVYWIGTD